MAPIRRYLRITKYSVLECRIYLDNPGLAQTWLLNPRHNVLPRVIEAVRPLVLPKLREERERARKRSTRKKGIKDVVVQDDFEVSIFLTETDTRHTLLTKHKHFHDTTQTKLTSNSGRLVGASNEAPIDLDLDAASAPIVLREEDSDDEAVGAALASIPAAPAAIDDNAAAANRRPKRAREGAQGGQSDQSDYEVVSSLGDDASNAESVRSDSLEPPPPHKRRREAADVGGEDDDKKKLAMDISYEGFSIYGRVLCLVVKRRDVPSLAAGSGRVAWGAGGSNSRAKQNSGSGVGQGMMENFIISTQIPAGEEDAPAAEVV